MPRRNESSTSCWRDADPQAVFDPNGLLDALKKALAERVLNAEIDHHLAGEEPGNRRNGYGKKTVMTDTGQIELEVPRDRGVVFERHRTFGPLPSAHDLDGSKYRVLSFMRFVGLALHDPVPDAKTIWLYREQLARAGATEKLFARFDALLRERGWLAMGGQIIDATVIEARRPRLSQVEKDTIKGSGVPAEWTPARRAQLDRDGRWTIKRGRKRDAGTGRPSAVSRYRRAGVWLQEPYRDRSRARVSAALHGDPCGRA